MEIVPFREQEIETEIDDFIILTAQLGYLLAWDDARPKGWPFLTVRLNETVSTHLQIDQRIECLLAGLIQSGVVEST